MILKIRLGICYMIIGYFRESFVVYKMQPNHFRVVLYSLARCVCLLSQFPRRAKMAGCIAWLENLGEIGVFFKETVRLYHKQVVGCLGTA